MNFKLILKGSFGNYISKVFLFFVTFILLHPPSFGREIETDLYPKNAIANLVLVYSDETLSLPLVGFSETIQGAVDLASDGNVLVVFPGTYTEDIVINKNIELRGANVGVNPNSGSRVLESIISDGSIDILGSNTVIIDGFHIYQTNTITPISLGGDSEVTIQNNIIERFGSTTGSTVRGIEISNGNGIRNILNNKFTGDVSGGLFGGHKTWNSGIFLNGPLGAINIEDNLFENCRTAINIDDMGSGISFSGNTFQNSGTFLAFGGTSPTSGSFALGPNEYKTLISTFVNLSNVTADFRLDISAGTYNGIAFNALPLATLFGIESTMFHRTRGSRNGLVYYVPNNQYLLNSVNNSIQIAIDYAVSDDIINVQGGTFTQNPIINKSIKLRGANFGINPNTGTRVAESILSGTFSLQSSGISIDGFRVTGAGAAFAAGGAGPWSDVSLTNNIAEGNTGQQTIVYGFASGAVTTSIGAENWVVSNNRISDIQLADATAIALFNITGLTISNNTILHSNTSFNGRRGMNIDGSRDVVISGNSVDLGVVNPLSDNTDGTFTKARYSLQLSASARSVTNVSVSGNTFGGAYDGIITLGNGEFSGVDLLSNEISNVVFGIRTQAGTNVPSGSHINFNIANNAISSSNRSIYLQSGAANSGTIDPYNAISINENSLSRSTAGAALEIDAAAIITDGSIAATCNWFGSADFAVVSSRLAGAINFVPFLTNGTDNEPSVIGFQPVANACDGVAPVRVYSDATETTLLSSHGTIQAGVNAAVAGNVVRVDAGTFTENVLVNKAILIRGANFGINPNTGTRVTESILSGTFSLQSSGINIDGFKVTGVGAAFAAGGTGPWSDVSLTNNFAEANTGQQTIVYGFASGGVTTSIGAENWEVSNNRIVDVQSANATALALFNIDGLVINGNVIEHSNTLFTGRRGINLDGSINVTVSGNTIDMGDVAPSALTNAPFGIQISMSDRAVSNITISGNSFTRAYSAIVGLSQRNLSDVLIENNEVSDVFRAFTFNSGGAVPVATGTNMADITITGNLVDASDFAVWLRNLHSAVLTGPVSFTNIIVTENSFIGGSFTVDADLNVTDGPVSGTCNWFGSSDFVSVDALVSGAVNFVPFLTNGTDNEPSVIGFQPVQSACGGIAPVRVYSDGTETTLLSSHGTIQAGVIAAVGGNVVRVDAGTYTENVLVDKSIFIRGANFGTNPNTGTRVGESILNGTFSLQSSGINIDGFKVTGAGAAFAAGGAGPWSNVSLTNNIAEGNTGQQTIVYGFASGAVVTSIGAEKWVVSNNRISDIQFADATAIALFNITGLTISNNTILHSNTSFARRRGMNIDGSRDVVISGNTVNLGLVNPLADNVAFDGARYSLQISASDRSVSNVSVTGNTFGGAYDGIITLGNGEYSGINLLSNDISNVVIAIRTQAGTNTPTGSHSNFTIRNNKISSSNRSIFLQSGGAGTIDPYNAISITENSLLRSSVGAALEIDAIAVITDGNIAANCNWFGSADFAVVDDLVTGAITFEPFLTDGTDNALGTIGFQPVPGKCNGTAIPPLSIVSFTLINAGTDTDILTITDGLQISQSQVQGLSLNIRANTNPPVVGSVFMTLSGPVNRSITENVAPYALFGDSNGNFNGRTLPLGNYTLTSQAYSGTNRNGTAGTLSSIQFSIVAAPVPVTGITSSPSSSSLVVGNTLQVTATVLPSNATNKTVLWSTSNQGVASVSNSGLVTALTSGSTTITATTQDGNFTALTLVTVTESTPPLSIASFTLINAGTDADILTITEGLQISQSQTQGLSLNIRANTFPSVVGSVFMTISGPVNRSITENVAPYALFGDTNGNFNGRTLPAGNYTITARAYSGANRGGTAGTTRTINFSITNSALRINENPTEKQGSSETQENPSEMEKNPELRDTPMVTRMYPNPVVDRINLELSNLEEERVEISVFDMKGILLLKQDYDSENGSLVLDISNLRLKPGTHVLLVNTNGHQQVFKFLKK